MQILKRLEHPAEEIRHHWYLGEGKKKTFFFFNLKPLYNMQYINRYAAYLWY